MKCKNCGIEVEGTFCPNCGEKVSEEGDVKVREKIKKEYLFSANKASRDVPYKVEIEEDTLRVSRVLKILKTELTDKPAEEINIHNIKDIKTSTVFSTGYAVGLVLLSFIMALIAPTMDLAVTISTIIIMWAVMFTESLINKKVEIISSNTIVFYSNSKSKRQLKEFMEDIKVNTYFSGNISQYKSKRQIAVVIFSVICMLISLVRVSSNDNAILEYVQNYKMDGNITVKEAAEDMWANGEWDCFIADEGTDDEHKRVVEYKVDDDNMIQFQLKDETMKMEDWYIAIKIDGYELTDRDIENLLY